MRSRRLGQVFTPRPIADWMARWACGHGPGSILDPAVGRGVFVDAVEAVCVREADCGAGVSPGHLPTELPQIEVCEIDREMLRRFEVERPHLRIHCRREDFIPADFERRFDAVLANPPYVRHHEMTYGEEVFKQFDRICRRRLSRMTNLYGLFLLKIWTLLGEGGRAAVITPAEWLNADFGVAIKSYLLDENAIDAIVHFDRASNVFEGALTTAAITLLRRGRRSNEAVRLLHVLDQAALAAVDVERGPSWDRSSLDPATKWTPLFTCDPARLAVTRRGASCSEPGRSSEQHPHTLGDIARCKRGIATGANDYFTLRESDRRRWGLDPRDLRPCVTKAQQVAGDRLTETDMQRLIDADQRCYLLSPRRPLAVAVRRYIEEGRRREIDRRHLPSHRPVWYMPEQRPPAPILVSVFARGQFRFVLNEAGVLNLTAYHGIYPANPDRQAVQSLFDYLTSSEAEAALARNRRVYGDGLLKVEPRDVEALPIPTKLFRACDQEPR